MNSTVHCCSATHECMDMVPGGQCEAPPEHDFISGDKVRCDVDMDLLTALQDSPEVAEKVSLVSSHCSINCTNECSNQWPRGCQ